MARNEPSYTMLVVGREGQVAGSLGRLDGTCGWHIVCRGRSDGLDIRSRSAIEDACSRLRPDILVNAAAYTAVDRAETEREAAHAANCLGPALLAGVCAAGGIPLIHLSTDYVFDGEKASSYLEDDPVSPLGVYGATKAEGEAAIRERHPAHLIVRTSWVYGVSGSNFVATMLRLGADRTALRVVDDQHGAPTFADDLAAGLLALATRVVERRGVPFGTYHLTGGGHTTWCGFAREIFRLAAATGDRSPEVIPIATADYPTPARRPKNSRLNCAKVERDFAVRLPAWPDGLTRCMKRIRAHEEPVA